MPGGIETLKRYLDESKTPEGRTRLLEEGHLKSALELQQSAADAWRSGGDGTTLLLLLRLLRNACASGAPAARIILSHANTLSDLACLAAELANRCTLSMGPNCGAAHAAAPPPPPPPPKGAGGSGPSPADEQLLLVAMQLLANFSVTSDEAAGAVWEACWPGRWPLLLSPQLDVRAQSAATMALQAGVRGSSQRAQLLCGSSPCALRIWAALLQPLAAPPPPPPAAAGAAVAAAAEPPVNDWLGLLVKGLVLEQGLLEPLMHCLEGAADSGQGSEAGASASTGESPAAPSGWRWSGAHVALLHVVAMEAEVAPQAGADEAGAAAGADAGDEPGADASGKPGASPGPATSTAGDAPHAHAPTAAVLAAAAGSCPALERLGGGTAGGEVDRPADAAVSGAERSLRAVLRLLQCAAGDTAAMTPGQPGAAASARLLEALLQVIKACVERGDGGRALCGGHDAVLLLQQEGLIRLLLAALAALGPPINPRKPASASQPGPAMLPLLAQLARGWPARRAPYVGYRSDLVACLANALFGRRAVQDEVFELGGVDHLLSSCQLDEAGPVAQQYALWAVRNMCEGHEGIQAAVAGLRVQDTVVSPDLERMGMQVQLDRATGKMKLVQQQPPHQPQQQQGSGAAG